MKNWTLSNYADVAQIAGVVLAIPLWWFRRDDFSKNWQKWITRILVILIAFGVLWLALRGWLDWIQNVLLWFKHPVALPVWSYFLMAGVLVVGIWGFRVIKRLRSKATKATPLPKQFQVDDYTQDMLEDVVWTWSYVYGEIRGLQAFCPVKGCFSRLQVDVDYRRAPGGYGRPPISLYCIHCGFRHEYDWDADELSYRVGLEIERRINSGEFRKQLALRQTNQVHS